jgi:formylmethanofuran dehydrogenase subunit B
MAATLGKADVPLETAVDCAAKLLAQSRCPVITGAGSDVAGMRAIFRLAARIAGTVDFLSASGAQNFYSAFTDKGMIFTTPREAGLRADVLLLVGPNAGRTEVIQDILSCDPVLSVGEGVPHEVVWLCSGDARKVLAEDDIMDIGGDVAALPGILAVLNACLHGHPQPVDGYGGISAMNYEEVAGRLMTARYGVIAWSVADLDPLAIETLRNTAAILNESTRIALLPLGLPSGIETAAQVSAWTTGFLPRTSFARGFPEFDPWRCDAERLIAEEECDVLLWVSSFAPSVPSWKTSIPIIALTVPGVRFHHPPAVHIETAIPGVTSDAEIYSETLQTIIRAEAETPSDIPTPVFILETLLTQLEEKAA